MTMAKTKNKGGRPRSVPKPQGIDRTALAHHCSVNVKTVDKWLRDGVPCTRYNGRVFFDVDAVVKWREEQDANPVEPVRAAVLHPDDPRYRERSAAAHVKAFKIALEQGNLVPLRSAVDRMHEGLANLNSRLNALSGMAGDLSLMTRDNARATLAPLVEELLEDFATTDAEETWPDSAFAPPVYDDDAEAFEARTYQPILGAGDPRAQFALMQAAAHERDLERLQRTSLAIDDVRRIMREQCDKVRAVVRKIPGRVAKRLGDEHPGHVVREAILYEIDAAKHEAVSALGAKPTWKPSPPTTPDEMEDDDCNVSGEFESEPEDV